MTEFESFFHPAVGRNAGRSHLGHTFTEKSLLHARETERQDGGMFYDEAGNVIETHEHKGDFKEW